MTGAPVPGRAPRAVRDALLSLGWEGESCEEAAAALEPWAHRLTGLSQEQLEALLRAAPKYGVDLLTGRDWALVAGTRSRLSALARSWTLPPELLEVVVSIGAGLPADPPRVWDTGGAVLDLATPLVLEALPAGVTVIEVDAGAGRPAPVEGGLLLRAADGRRALEACAAALDALLAAGQDLERVALDPGWRPGLPPLGLHRRFGRPLVATTDDPVCAALARLAGAQIFLTGAPGPIRRAIELADAGA